jgi:phosphoserine phosphatase
MGSWDGGERMEKPGETSAFLLLDLDGTLTTVKSPWRYVYERLGIWRSVGEKVLERYLSGEISYSLFCRLDVEAWEARGADLHVIESILDEIPIPPQSFRFLGALSQAGFSTTILSTGLERVALNLSGRFGRPFSRNLRPVINGIRLNGGRLEPVLRVHEGETRKGKGAWARRLVRLSGVPLHRTFAVGDGSSDRLMFPHVGKGFAVQGPEDLPEVLERVLRGTRAPLRYT